MRNGLFLIVLQALNDGDRYISVNHSPYPSFHSIQRLPSDATLQMTDDII